MKNKRFLIILSAIAVLLLIPFVAMQFTDEVAWSGFDFVAMGSLLLTTGVLCEIVMRKVMTTSYRILLCTIILFALIVVWAQLAVGVFGSFIAGS